MRFDTVIQNGMVVDGSGGPRFKGDVGMKDGIITEIGRLSGANAKSTIDAEGLVVAPGFIDLHTHYDAQLFWDPYCSISSWHGITTVVIGNCGFGFAPVAPESRDRAMLSMIRMIAVMGRYVMRRMTMTGCRRGQGRGEQRGKNGNGKE